MLNEEQADQIVVDCIRAVSHIHIVDITGTLDGAEISDTPGVNNMITLIINSKHIGVPSQQHRIDASWFQDVDSDSAVFDVIGIVRDNSSRVLENPLEDFASLVAKHFVDHLSASKKSVSKKSVSKSKSKAKKGNK